MKHYLRSTWYHFIAWITLPREDYRQWRDAVAHIEREIKASDAILERLSKTAGRPELNEETLAEAGRKVRRSLEGD